MTSTRSDDPAEPIVDLAMIERAVGRWCSKLDPAVLTGSDAVVGTERLAVVIRRCQAAQVLLARRAEACNAYAARAHSGCGLAGHAERLVQR